MLLLAVVVFAAVAVVLLGPCSGGARGAAGDLDRAATPSPGDALVGNALPAGGEAAEGPSREPDPGAGTVVGAVVDAEAVLHVMVYAADSDAPLPGQAMQVRDIGGLWPWPLLGAAETDEGGEVRIAVPAQRALMLQLKPDAWWAADFLRVKPLAIGEERSVRIDLHQQPRYRGTLTVREHSGRPVADATVVALEPGAFTAAISGPDGVARLDDLRENDRAFYRVQAEGYADSFGELSPQQPHGEVVLERGAALEGVLRLADGRVADGVAVRLRADPRKIGVAESSLRLAWESTCAADGAFRFAHLPIDAVLLLEARHEGAGITEVLAPMRPGVQVLDLQMRPAPIVRGRVVDAAARPIAGVEMHLDAVLVLDPSGYGNRLDGFPRRTVTTGADGRFEFGVEQGLHAGKWLLGTAGSLDGSSRPGASYGAAYRYLPARQEFELAPGQDAVDLLFELEGGGTIRGRLLDHLGEPVTQGTVVAHPVSNRSGAGRVQTADLGADGSFVLEPLKRDTTYRLNGQDPVREIWGSLQEVPVGGPEVELRLPPPPGRLLGQVVDRVGRGTHATGHGYERIAGGRDSWVLRIEPDGRFEHRLEEGQTFDLMIWTRDGRAATLSDVSVPAGETREAELRLVEGTRVVPGPGFSASLEPRVELLLDGVTVYRGFGMRLEDAFFLPPGSLEVRCWQGDLELPAQYHRLVAGHTLELTWPAAG